MKSIRLLAVCGLLLAPGIAAAQPEKPADAPAAAAQGNAPTSQEQADYKNETICKAVTATGSRLGKQKVCRTRAGWEQMTDNARQATGQSQKQGYMDRGG